MRNMLKATTLERKFPLLAVENGCIYGAYNEAVFQW